EKPRNTKTLRRTRTRRNAKKNGTIKPLAETDKIKKNLRLRTGAHFLEKHQPNSRRIFSLSDLSSESFRNQHNLLYSSRVLNSKIKTIGGTSPRAPDTRRQLLHKAAGTALSHEVWTAELNGQCPEKKKL
ncbi:hypothetical protein, partial [Methanocorpusculum vombati]